MSPPRRSQSALEYMMTYGWAILVIVIVAAVLYSLGIFSPSSSLSTTVTGFANTPVSSAAFTNNGGLAFSVGDLVGYPIEITNVTEITASGSKITILPNITVSPSQTKVIIIPKAFSSSTQGSHESVSLTITYTEPGQVFPGPYTSTGTVSGTTPTLFFPINQTFAAVSKLTITNSQTTATPSPFQQMINVTSSTPGWAYISQDFGQNVEFFYPNGTIIPSWLENYTSSHALWWVKVGSIPASSSITIYVGFASSSTNLFNTVNDGEAPQLSSTYAEYDDGANVFNFYDNFKGTSLDTSKWTSGSSIPSSASGSITVNNGIALTYSGSTSGTGGVWIESTSTFTQSQPFVWETLENLYGSSGSDIRAREYIWQSGQTSIADNSAYSWCYLVTSKDYGYMSSSSYTNQAPVDWESSPTSYVVPAASSTTDYTFINQEILNSSGFAFRQLSPSETLLNSNSQSGSNSDTFVLLFQASQDPQAGTTQINIGWTRVRAYPPNGVMPSVSFGSVS